MDLQIDFWRRDILVVSSRGFWHITGFWTNSCYDTYGVFYGVGFWRFLGYYYDIGFRVYSGTKPCLKSTYCIMSKTVYNYRTVNAVSARPGNSVIIFNVIVGRNVKNDKMTSWMRNKSTKTLGYGKKLLKKELPFMYR